MGTSDWFSVRHPWRLMAITIALALLLDVSATLVPIPDAGAQSGQDRRRPGRPVIVTVEPGADPRAVARRLGISPDLVYAHAITGFAARIPVRTMSALAGEPAVVTITPDKKVRAYDELDQGRRRDRRKGRKQRQQQRVPTGLNRIDAERSTLAAINRDGGVVDVDVAVLDTGISAHSELNIAGGKVCIGNGGFGDGDGHGTHVAGTIAARDNARGVVGVAPGARLWAVKVLNDNGTGTISSLICGLDYVAASFNTIDVVNMSIGATSHQQSSCNNDALHDAVCTVVDRGVPVVVAAGNENRKAAHSVPAQYDEAITVSALADFNGRPGGRGKRTCARDEDDSFARFSNDGHDVDLMAPGVCIRSTYKGKSYATMSGTSMAAPHVAGAAALYLSVNPGASPAQVRSWLTNADASRFQNDASFGLARDDDNDGHPEPILYLGGT